MHGLMCRGNCYPEQAATSEGGTCGGRKGCGLGSGEKPARNRVCRFLLRLPPSLLGKLSSGKGEERFKIDSCNA